MYSLFSFLPEQTCFIFRPAIKLTNLLHFLAFFGQIATQCIQEIHFALSVNFGFSKEMAPVGHSFTHRPQEVHFPFAAGLNGTPPYSRYGFFPGNCGVICVSLFCMILAANSNNSFSSCRSGRPVPNWCIKECSATASIPAIHTKPDASRTSCSSNKVSSIARFPNTTARIAFVPSAFTFRNISTTTDGTRPP